MKEFNEFQNENFEKSVMVEEGPKHDIEEGPKHDIEERPKREIKEGPKQDIEERPKHEVEDKINLIINLSTDKNELIKLKRIILEFDEEKKLKEKEMIRDVERKIKRR